MPVILTGLMLATGVQAQDETGLPGDNFSLEGALEMFKKAENPEAFEKMLNTEENGVNNLDLNNDGDIDYIRVVNKKDGNIQLFVLQALVSSSESQDIAVIELEKTGNETAVAQIVGDEDIYGVAKIVEPNEDDNATAFSDASTSGKLHGPNAALAPAGIVVNVWFWPSVRFVFAPYYTGWVSPWRWYHYPRWWHPWRPLSWHAYQPVCNWYRPRYTIVHTHRIIRAPQIYRPMRVTSVSVYNRNRVVVNNYRTNYRGTPNRYYDRSAGSRTDAPRRYYDRNRPDLREGRNSSPVNVPGREYDRRAPRREYERNRPDVRTTPNSPAVTTPERGFDRRAPRREFDRNRPDVRSAPVTTPGRTFDRSTPRGQYNRPAGNVTPSQRQYDQRSSIPRREMQRSSGAVSAPSRQFDGGRSSGPDNRQSGGTERSRPAR